MGGHEDLKEHALSLQVPLRDFPQRDGPVVCTRQAQVRCGSAGWFWRFAPHRQHRRYSELRHINRS